MAWKCVSHAGGLPDIYVIVLPDGAADIYQRIKQ
jgi:hypothetical protein